MMANILADYVRKRMWNGAQMCRVIFFWNCMNLWRNNVYLFLNLERSISIRQQYLAETP